MLALIVLYLGLAIYKTKKLKYKKKKDADLFDDSAMLCDSDIVSLEPKVKDYDPKGKLKFKIVDLESLKEAFKIRYRKLFLIKLETILMCSTITGVFIYISTLIDSDDGADLGIGLGIFILYYLARSKYWRELGDNAYADIVISPAIATVLPGAKYRYQSHINTDDLFDNFILLKGNSPAGSAHIVYGDENNPDEYFEMSNLRVNHTSGSGKNKTTYTYFDGNVIKLKLSRGINGTVRIMPSTTNVFGKEKVGRFVKCQEHETAIDVENIEFNKTFEVFAANEVEGYVIVSPYVTERLMKLREICNTFSLAVYTDELYICFDNHPYYFTTPYKITKDNISYFQTEEQSKVVMEVVKLGREISTYISGHIV